MASDFVFIRGSIEVELKKAGHEEMELYSDACGEEDLMKLFWVVLE